MDEGMKQNRAWGNLNALAIGYAYQGRLRIAQGNLDAAQACLLETEKIDQRYTLYFDVRSQYLSCRVRLYLAQGDVQAAARIIKEDGISPDDPLSFKNEGDHITLARALIAQGRHEESEGLLRRLAGAAEAGGRFGRLIEISYLRAIALQAMGRGNEAIQALETSLKLAEPEGYIRNFVDEGEPMAKLLAIAIQKGVLPEYANLLLSAFPGARLRLPEEKNIHKQDRALIEPLSEREVEVLQLLAAGLANKEIAQRLFISVRTVKFHTTGIYSKLGVKGRHEACERARQLRLLE
jgi:LuxR family maltose regulon positive regulatory protein